MLLYKEKQYKEETDIAMDVEFHEITKTPQLISQ